LSVSFVFALRRLTDLPLNFEDDVAWHSARQQFCVDLKGIVMSIGTVKFFNSSRGYGFIEPEGGASDVFVHISAVERAGLRSLVEGQKVSFDLVKDARSGKTSADNLQAV
jgi:CspA family cold shock protein